MARRKSRKSSRRVSVARQNNAKARPRGADGKFLSNAEIAALEAENGAVHFDQQKPAPTSATTPTSASAPVSQSRSVDLDSAMDDLRTNGAAKPTYSAGKSPLERSLARHTRKLNLDQRN